MTDLAPELAISRWFNVQEPPSLAALRGKVVVLHAFQMLCPGCVAHSLPQAEKLHRLFAPGGQLVVLGLHTVFEHHAAMTETALAAFIHEYRLTLPVGVDRPDHGDPIPATMRRYGMRGTPTTIVIDREGRIRQHAFGQVDDLALGALVGSLVSEPLLRPGMSDPESRACNDDGCPLPGRGLE